MPGKVNPTQCEPWSWSASQVAGRRLGDRVRRVAGATSELNAMRPVIIANFLHSAVILPTPAASSASTASKAPELQPRDQVSAYVNGSADAGDALSR